MNQSQDYTSLGQQRIPSPNTYTDWLPREFHDDNFFLDGSLDQPLNLTPEEERLFRSFGDGLDGGLGSLENSSEPIDERQVVYAEAHAAGLFKGGIRRAAFSMGDLQALQPPEPPILLPPLQSQGMRPPLPPAGSSKPPRLESVPESKALPAHSSLYGGNMMLSSRLSDLSTGGMSDGPMDNQTLDQLSADLAADLQSSFDPHDVPMPLFGEQQRPGHPGMGGVAADPAMVKAEPRDGMLGMYPPGATPSYPATSSAATMFDYAFMDDGKKMGMVPNKVEDFGSQGFPSDSNMDIRGFADHLLAPPRPPQPQGQEKPSFPGREGGEQKDAQAEKDREKEQQRQRMLRRSRSAVELRGLGGSLARHGSTPDLQQHVRSSGLVELTNPEGQTYTAGRLSNEERAQKILRYRQKRHERNFNKRIKYMCRKTLADSRPRVRGRFARNDDTAAVMPHETKKALAEKARKEKKANAEAAAAEAAAAAAAAAHHPQQDYWGGGRGGPLLTGPPGSYPAMIPNSNSGIFGGDYFGSANSNCYSFPSLPGGGM